MQSLKVHGIYFINVIIQHHFIFIKPECRPQKGDGEDQITSCSLTHFRLKKMAYPRLLLRKFWKWNKDWLSQSWQAALNHAQERMAEEEAVDKAGLQRKQSD